MADTHVAIGGNARPEVTLRPASVIPSVVARPVPISTPGTSVSPSNDTDQLLRALDIQGGKLSASLEKANKEAQEDAFKEGQKAQVENQTGWAEAVAAGKVDPSANPWFIKGFHTQEGRVAGLDYYTELKKAYGGSEAKGNDDPKVFAKFQQDFTAKYMAEKGKDKSTEWWDGFRVTSDSARAQVNSEHAQQAEQTMIAKQEANTGAEINVILNSTRDPVEAGRLLNEKKAQMKLAGMPEQNFDKVAAEAILAKAKLGDAGALETLKHVKTGDSGTLASNPKVASAAVDTSNAIKEQGRADTRWNWAVQDRQFSMQSQQHAKEGWVREKDRWAKEDQTWDRQSRARSLTTTIILGTMGNSSDYRNATKDDIARLAAIDPAAVESVTGWQERYTTRQEQVPEANEKPVRAQLQAEMLRAAGNPLLQQQLQLQAIKLGGAGKLNKETVYRLIDDSTRFWSLDPTSQRKLQDPQVTAVLRTAREVYMKEGSLSVVGSNALDALATEQVINKAVLDHLLAKPTADGFELGQVAARALESVLPTTSQDTLGKGKINQLSGQTATGIERATQFGPDNPKGQVPAGQQGAVTAAEAVGKITAADKMEFLRDANAAHQKGASAFLAFIAEFDQKVGVPGVGQAIITQSATPPAPPTKKK